MAHPNETFPFNPSSRQVEASGSVAQHNEIGLFAVWFVDRPKNLDNVICRGPSPSLDLNLSTGYRLSLPLSQEAPLH
ncbi:hypothetical protein J1N35_034521 [Gossypium stocksii]|uniref:Uncharacterized protein n=1 Tax=Gossypium stocksii TaxID=47602 RepID=A0A9D3USH1_9ROSI|nr:hypothetical protein J1N35_034521 [Gossypium stocksii]